MSGEYLAGDDPVQAALHRARALISAPGAWAKGAYARDAQGREAYPECSDAVAFSVVGAVARVCAGNEWLLAETLLVLHHTLAPDGTGLGLQGWNDKLPSVAAVLALYDAAVAFSAAKGAA